MLTISDIRHTGRQSFGLLDCSVGPLQGMLFSPGTQFNCSRVQMTRMPVMFCSASPFALVCTCCRHCWMWIEIVLAEPYCWWLLSLLLYQPRRENDVSYWPIWQCNDINDIRYWSNTNLGMRLLSSRYYETDRLKYRLSLKFDCTLLVLKCTVLDHISFWCKLWFEIVFGWIRTDSPIYPTSAFSNPNCFHHLAGLWLK